MNRPLLLVVLVCTVFGMPLLCDAGVAEHECVCVTLDCCESESVCEWDNCGAVFKIEEWRRHHETAALGPPAVAGCELAALHAADSAAGPRTQRTHVSPYPDSDLPLRI